jgi:hypothetical protein
VRGRFKKIRTRDGIEQIGRRRAKERSVREDGHRDQRRKIRIDPRRPRLDVPALKLAAQPIAILEVVGGISPRPNLGLDHERQSDAPPPPCLAQTIRFHLLSQTVTPSSRNDNSANVSQCSSSFRAIASSSALFRRATSAVSSSPARVAIRSSSW